MAYLLLCGQGCSSQFESGTTWLATSMNKEAGSHSPLIGPRICAISPREASKCRFLLGPGRTSDRQQQPAGALLRFPAAEEEETIQNTRARRESEPVLDSLIQNSIALFNTGKRKCLKHAGAKSERASFRQFLSKTRWRAKSFRQFSRSSKIKARDRCQTVPTADSPQADHHYRYFVMAMIDHMKYYGHNVTYLLNTVIGVRCNSVCLQQ